MIYLDNSATSKIDSEVLNEMMPYLTENFGNSSTPYSLGKISKKAVDEARIKVASLIGANPKEIYFTSGGTESDNIAIKGVAYSLKNKGNHIITSIIEHPAVLETCKYLEKNGFSITYVPVQNDGIINISEVKRAITPSTILITIMHANSEIGTIQPIEEIGKIAKENGIYFHTDAVQSVGKIPVDVDSLNVDLLSMSSHKIHGPKGIGALYIRKGLKISPIIHGGGQEQNIRPGTENVPGIVGFGKACEIAKRDLEKNMVQMTFLRDELIKGVLQNIKESYLNGHPEKRLPNNAHFRFTGIEGESLLLRLNLKGIAVSTGSACSSKSLEPSKVLKSIGLENVDSHGSLRLSLSKDTTLKEVQQVILELVEVVEKLRNISALW
ncbi:aminotransferase class V [Methanococcus vannielii SB]|jgi:cysteine desulfurase|uniref:Cysteine desulfurase IscS n=1 Tax=Methanococcus vannielii (strain ATCC 35089 / DSM 1224 / JCM 13029 / OCM 148 / SB) TaxID=406327 RepID=A6UNL2_METVS|nr:cysteine desulfurase NifS [Methanococcus vannielii]ABR54084.1 aminotransferase class V [Methanococcus vannielii SB]